MKDLTFRKKDVTFKRRLETIDRNMYKMVQSIEARNSYLASIVTANNGIFTEIHTHGSNYQFCVNDSFVTVKEREFLLYIPPFSLVQFIISPGTSYTVGVATRKPPVLFSAFVTTDISFQRIVESGFDQKIFLGKKLINVARCSHPSSLSSSVKRILV